METFSKSHVIRMNANLVKKKLFTLFKQKIELYTLLATFFLKQFNYCLNAVN